MHQPFASICSNP